MKYLLSLREANVGGAVVPGRLELGDGFADLDHLRVEPRVTVLLHGFNVDYAAGKTALSRFMDEIPSAMDGGGVMAVLWPGDHWTGAASYSFEGRDADDSAVALTRFLGDAFPLRVPISLVAHSLGSRVALNAAEALALAGFDIAQICLLAAAVDDDSLAAPNDFLFAAESARRVAVLWSKKDGVLKWAYPAGDLLQAFLFLRDSPGMALGYKGPKAHRRSRTDVPANVIDLRIPNDRDADHSDYLPPSKASERLTPEQRSAGQFTDAVLRGETRPLYPPRDAA